MVETVAIVDRTARLHRPNYLHHSYRVNGRPIARMGDQVRCPRHGVNPIIEGDTSTLLDGRPIALEGHRTRCGCVLIGSGNGSVG